MSSLELYNPSNVKFSKFSEKFTRVRVNATSTNAKCIFCHNAHTIYACPSFTKKSVLDREKFISNESRCFNCLGKGHSLKDCKSIRNCFHCNKRHNSLLHKENVSQPIPNSRVNSNTTTSPNTSSSDDNVVISVNSSFRRSSSTILPTCVISLKTIFNTYVEVRVLLDSGSMVSLISESKFNELGIKRNQSRISITCVADKASFASKGHATLGIRNKSTKEICATTVAHIVQKVMSDLPSQTIDISSINYLRERFDLADPNFNMPASIDMILGAPTFFELIRAEKFLQPRDNLHIQNTALGYIVCSKDHIDLDQVFVNTVCVDETNKADETLEKFWALEEPPSYFKPITVEDQKCEEIFKSTTVRLCDGRFSVNLPFKQDPKTALGSSYDVALRRFFSLERKLNQDDEFKNAYHKFMAEYEQLEHMEKIEIDHSINNISRYYFIPHHGIWQGSSKGKKLRVVFDASAKTSNGTSLNDILHIGPPLQRDLISIINRFRWYEYVMCADIEKMYRQIAINPCHRNYQIILWRSSINQPVSAYRLNTVTYGQSCSPFLALRAIDELINVDGPKYPLASEALHMGRYVDDIFFGTNNIDDLKQLRSDLVSLLKLGMFELKKWASNSKELMKQFPGDELANPLLLSDNNDLTIKTLGIQWRPQDDCFSFTISNDRISIRSKRNLLSETAKLFDPLGWISPIILKLKILFQETWVRQLTWDNELPLDILNECNKLLTQLPSISQISIPRFLGCGIDEIHGFADASNAAYAAVVYLRRISLTGDVFTRILISKTKLAPIKQISIPRLELCAAHLLAKLIKGLELPSTPTKTVLWTDSKIVLSWIKSMPRKWTTFVGNRISHIHELCPQIKWYHVKSSQNPADIASRGLHPTELINNELWWHGPSFLRQSDYTPEEVEPPETNEELVKTTVCSVLTQENFISEIISRFSSFNRLIRSFAYVHRIKHRLLFKSHKVPPTDPLSAHEIKQSLEFIIKSIQYNAFPDLINSLKMSRNIPKNNSLRSLAPFLDQSQCLRVSGRLGLTELQSFNPQPIVIPKGHFAWLLINKYHLDNYHGSINLVLTQIRKNFWVVGVKKLVQTYMHHCKVCLRYQGVTYAPLMGDVPNYRLNPQKPFFSTGVDFAGPFTLRAFKHRGNLSTKAYLCVFICLVTRAIHLELVMSLSTDSLISALRRFLSRRGKCETFYSDNGKNFVGCSRIFKSLNLSNIADDPDLHTFLSNQLIQWKFIPPYSPHFGGLWEAAVKSTKRHLNRTFNGAILTVEETHTALCEIESILNSRPLTPLVLDSPLIPLTPAHLLTGELVGSLPLTLKQGDSDLQALRKDIVHNLVITFWKRWRDEYVDSLMRRPKWNTSTKNPIVGDLVLIKKPNDPPRFWRLGRIAKLLPGKDKIVRVVQLTTLSGNHTEAVRNLVPVNINASALMGGSM